MDYLVVAILSFIAGIFAHRKFLEAQKEKSRNQAAKKKAAEVIVIQGKQYVPKKTKGKVKV